MIAEILASNCGGNEYGPSIADSLAKAFKGLLEKSHSKEDISKYKEQFKTPDNAKILGTPKINIEIWQNLARRAQTKDAAQQFVQQAVGRALVAQARTAQLLVDNSKRIPPE